MPEKKLELVPFKETILLETSSENPTLMVDTISELRKGYHWLNLLLDEVVEQRYVEEFEDDNGNIRKQTKFHPYTLRLMEERRKTIDQVYRISGEETNNEIKKEMGKLSAKMVFESSGNKKMKKEYIEEFKKVVEAEYDED